MKIGIDIGGTHTDIVLIDDAENIVSHTKEKTSSDVVTGVVNGIKKIAGHCQKDCKEIFLGTTIATNAILQHDALLKRIGLIRICSSNLDSIPPACTWDADLKKHVFCGYEVISGGHECDGKEIGKLKPEDVVVATKKLIDGGADAIVLNSTFGHIYPQHEQIAESIIRSSFPNIDVRRASEICNIGIIERETTAIMNASLCGAVGSAFATIEKSLAEEGFNAKIFVVQNNGTSMSIQEATLDPIKTISAGPTNSFFGALALTGLKDAIVLDIGGTSTDCGIIEDGVPKRGASNVTIGGASFSFISPDVISVGIGGGSIIKVDKDKVSIGPQSVGSLLQEKALSFGGDCLTLTDAAISLDIVQIPNAKKSVETELAKKIIQKFTDEMLDLCSRINPNNKPMPIVFVGGGASLLNKTLLPNNTIIPQLSGVCNARGATMAKISGVVDKVISMSEKSISECEAEAIAAAIKHGAKNPKITEKDIFPYYYMPNNIARVRIVAIDKSNS